MSAPDTWTCRNDEEGAASDRLEGGGDHEMPPPPPDPATMTTSFPHAASSTAATATPQCGNALRQETKEYVINVGGDSRYTPNMVYKGHLHKGHMGPFEKIKGKSIVSSIRLRDKITSTT